jgi:hypothetical protein
MTEDVFCEGKEMKGDGCDIILCLERDKYFVLIYILYTEPESVGSNLGKILPVIRTGFELRTHSRAVPLHQSVLA